MKEDRRKFLKNTGSSLLATYLLGINLSSCNKKVVELNMFNAIPAQSPFQMKFLRGRVGYFTEKGGTIGWMVDGKRSVVVDSQFPDQARNFNNQLLKVTDEKIDILFNTHHHGDHTSGNIIFKDKVGKIVAHINSFANQKKVAIEQNNVAENLFPTETFDITYSAKVGNENILCFCYGPAHTNGDSIVHFQESNVVHLGDLLFNRRFPYIDKGSGASISNWIKVHDDILNQFDNETIFIAGHAGQGHSVIATKEDIKAFQNYLAKLLELGQKIKSMGMTKDEVLEKYKTVPGAEEWTGDGLQRSIDALFVEMNL